MKTKPAAKKTPAKRPATKKARITKDSFDQGKTLLELVEEWDSQQPAPRPILKIAEEFDEQCNRLHEISMLMDVAGEDLFDSNSERTGTLLCMAERMIKETRDKCSELSSELFRANRRILAGKG